SVDQHRRSDVAVLPDHGAAELLREDSRALGRRVGEQCGVPFGQESHRCRRVAVWKWGAWEVEHYASTLVAERPQLAPLQTCSCVTGPSIAAARTRRESSSRCCDVTRGVVSRAARSHAATKYG